MARPSGQKQLLYLTAREVAELYESLFEADFPDKTCTRKLNNIVSTVNQYGNPVQLKLKVQADDEKSSLVIPCEIAELICLLVYLENKSDEYRLIARSDDQEDRYRKANAKNRKSYKSSKSKKELSQFTIERVFTFVEDYEFGVRKLDLLTRQQLNKAFNSYFSNWSTLIERYQQLKKLKQRFLSVIIKFYNLDGQHPYMNLPTALQDGKQFKACTFSEQYISRLSEACDNLLSEIYLHENREFSEIQNNLVFILCHFFRDDMNDSLEESIASSIHTFTPDQLTINSDIFIPFSLEKHLIGNVYQKVLGIICTKIKEIYYDTNDDKNFRHRQYIELIHKEKLTQDEKSFLSLTKTLKIALFERAEPFRPTPELNKELKDWMKKYLDIMLKVYKEISCMEQDISLNDVSMEKWTETKRYFEWWMTKLQNHLNDIENADIKKADNSIIKAVRLVNNLLYTYQFTFKELPETLKQYGEESRNRLNPSKLKAKFIDGQLVITSPLAFSEDSDEFRCVKAIAEYSDILIDWYCIQSAETIEIQRKYLSKYPIIDPLNTPTVFLSTYEDLKNNASEYIMKAYPGIPAGSFVCGMEIFLKEYIDYFKPKNQSLFEWLEESREYLINHMVTTFDSFTKQYYECVPIYRFDETITQLQVYKDAEKYFNDMMDVLMSRMNYEETVDMSPVPETDEK